MDVLKIYEQKSDAISDTKEIVISIDQLTTEEELKEVKQIIYKKKIKGAVFFNVSLKEKELTEVLYKLTENLNIPVVLNDETKDLKKQIQNKRESYPFELTYFDYPKGKQEYSIESLLTVGNGYLGLRGTSPEMLISDSNYPGTYVASVYNTAESLVDNTTIENEDFVNLPNGQKMYLIIDGEVITIEDNDLNSIKRTLNLKTGELTINSEIMLKNGALLSICVNKMASMSQRNYYGIQYSFKLDRLVSDIQFVSELDGDVNNYNVERYRKLTNHHLTVIDKKVEGAKASLLVRTNQSNIEVYQESRLLSQDINLNKLDNQILDKKIKQQVTITAEADKWLTVEKIVFMTKNQTEDKALNEFPKYTNLLLESEKEWEKLWEEAAIKVTGDLMSQKMLNLHTYHMLSSASPNGNKDLDASITARGLHGEAYRGHIFWDELFMLPFYIIHFPETAKQLLMYRYDRLEMAKQLAKEEGHLGAMYPWQSGLDGREQSQKLHLNPLSGEWKEDHSRRQRHVSLAIAYNVWSYYQYTKDQDFLNNYGTEMLTEITKFWLSLTTYDEKKDRYSIKGVMGPDEFHEAYSGSKEGGLDNNAYTNLMVTWLLGIMPIVKKESLTAVNLDFETINNIQKKLKLDINEAGVIAQFEGYFNLKEIDWDYYQNKYGNVYRMDRILNAEGKSPDDYKVAKQADSLMIFYNFPKEKVTELLTTLNYHLPEDYVEKNLLYYLNRTSHGSTLSRVVHSQLAEMVDDRELAWKLYQEALYSDYRDIQGGTTAEGIHTGVMASTLHITLSAFAGLDIRGDLIKLNPHLPEQWSELSFTFSKQLIHFKVTVTKNTIVIYVNKDCSVMIGSECVSLKAKENNVINY
ncbi:MULTISPECIES: glycosyl hydrolase family 65 protein [Vagococcus]|uniref:Trehalose 6-phosphate phosphorylase n=1 Tax=Vagococcus fluvialis bH819 TaxID=1255619 RepID=A0A1X6WK30_9ENTE|nr:MULTISPECIES: glycosyl hydrolase family 65 protein [Vagococcus]SLM84673.1 Trehalose 6-phosphate phosphorylase [Vagococcus fluvialis bH819]HCM89863.1 glycoside hydrolase family 65 protein [Vagococcus sp.]